MLDGREGAGNEGLQLVDKDVSKLLAVRVQHIGAVREEFEHTQSKVCVVEQARLEQPENSKGRER